MTINELHQAVKVELDKPSSLGLSAFEQEEIDYWLNRAIQRFIEEKVNLYLSSKDNEKVISKILEDLTPLISIDYTTTYAGSFPGDYMFILSAYISITKTLEDGTTVTNEKVPCDIINENEVHKYMETPTNKPYFDNPKFIISADMGSNVIVDSFTTALATNTVYLNYVSEPTKVEDVTPNRDTEYTDLPENTHYNIARLAATLMLENIEADRYQTSKEITNNEL